MKNKKPNILFFSTYPPRECGIATYTKNLIDSIDKSKVNIEVVAINDQKYKYDPIVKYEIDQQKKSDYVKLAQKINVSSIDVASIQHEFGIFGGFNGRMILDFLKHLKKLPMQLDGLSNIQKHVISWKIKHIVMLELKLGRKLPENI